ncbi:MAG: hypothetical protein C0592_00235 [Marinilabiliales bacterium]|nr:MAG: hypothetical protein C0592_00235 [Marinilabiliales bacterium]
MTLNEAQMGADFFGNTDYSPLRISVIQIPQIALFLTPYRLWRNCKNFATRDVNVPDAGLTQIKTQLSC